ncbi:SDR family NAD(P)-dependent oxidoreductase, partial [Acidobacteriota bacterium]
MEYNVPNDFYREEKMTEKIALVTGSGKGIGRDIALRLASTVSGVAVHYFRDRKAAQETVSMVVDAGAAGKSFRADLTVEDEALQLVHQVEEAFGRIDLLINNVGPIQVKPWADTGSEDWDRILSGNLKTSHFCMK